MYLIICTIRRESFVGLFDRKSLPIFLQWLSENNQSEELLQKIDTVLINNNITKRNIKGIAVINGPGSYTGIRVGVATANGLGLSLNIPVIGINILEICANYFFKEFNYSKIVIALTKSIYDKYYFAEFQKVGIEVMIKKLGNESLKDINITDNSKKYIFLMEKDAQITLNSINIEVWENKLLNYLADYCKSKIIKAEEKDFALPFYINRPNIT